MGKRERMSNRGNLPPDVGEMTGLIDSSRASCSEACHLLFMSASLTS